MKSNVLTIVLLVILVLSISALTVLGVYVGKEIKNHYQQDYQLSQVEIIQGDSYRLVQNETNKWLNEHKDVVITSVNIECSVVNTEVHYCSTIVYKAK